MADTVSTITLQNTPKRLVLKFLCRSDGSGESGVTKVDKSTFTGLNGLEPSSFLIERIEYDIAGMEVLIYADHTSPLNLFRMQGTGGGDLDYRQVGGVSTAASGGTGDILFSTNGASSGDSYDVTLFMKKID